MACYHPLDAFRSNEPKPNGKHQIFFNDNPPPDATHIQLPCGQCIGCRLDKSKEWAVRCLHESTLHDNNCFITLTYNEENYPPDESLNPRHFQLFMKRLRKAFPNQTIRYFHCGEYGEKLARPHYHACIFGIDFNDKKPFSLSENIITYTSEKLERIWGKGFCTIGALTIETAAYTARYVTKKITGEAAYDHYMNFCRYTGEIIMSKQPEYATMSLCPGIGTGWLEKFESDLRHDFIIVNGKKFKLPKFYNKHFELVDPDTYQVIKEIRIERAEKHADNNTPERLSVREKIHKTKAKNLQRKIHHD